MKCWEKKLHWNSTRTLRTILNKWKQHLQNSSCTATSSSVRRLDAIEYLQERWTIGTDYIIRVINSTLWWWTWYIYIYIYILMSAYLGSQLLLRQVLLKTMKHCLLFLIQIFQILLFFLCRDQTVNLNYSTPEDDQKSGRKCLCRRYGTIPLPPGSQQKKNIKTWKITIKNYKQVFPCL